MTNPEATDPTPTRDAARTDAPRTDAPPPGVPSFADLPTTKMTAAACSRMARDMATLLDMALTADREVPYGQEMVRRNAHGLIVRDANGPLLHRDALGNEDRRTIKGTRRLRMGTTLMRSSDAGSMTIRNVVTADASRACGYLVKLRIALHRTDVPEIDMEVECEPEAVTTRPGRAHAIHVATRIKAVADGLAALRAGVRNEAEAPYLPPDAERFARLLDDVARIVAGAPASSPGWPEAHLAAVSDMDRPGGARGLVEADGRATPTILALCFEDLGGSSRPEEAKVWGLDGASARIMSAAIPATWRLGNAHESFYDAGPFTFEAGIPREETDGTESLRIAQRLGWDHAPCIGHVVEDGRGMKE